MYHVMLFTDFIHDVKTRYMIGFSFIVFTAVFIFVHLIIMMKDTISKVRDSYKKKQKKKADAAAVQ